MGKRKREPPSSLELFLDTICNTFGGIVFLAILLSVIVQNRTREADLPQNETSVSPQEAQAMALRGELLNNRFSQLSQLVDDLKSLQPTNIDNRVDQIADQLKEAQQALAQELEQQKKLASQIAEQARKNAQLAKSHSELEQKTENAKKSLANEKARLKEQLDDRMQILNLPRVEAVSKRTVILMMRFGKLYRLFSEGQKLDKTHLTVTDESSTQFTVEPKRGEGWRVSDVSQRLLIHQYLAAYPQSSYAAHVFVWPDSFGQFSELKRILIEQNYQYELAPYADGSTLTLVRSNHTPMVQ